MSAQLGRPLLEGEQEAHQDGMVNEQYENRKCSTQTNASTTSNASAHASWASSFFDNGLMFLPDIQDRIRHLRYRKWTHFLLSLGLCQILILLVQVNGKTTEDVLSNTTHTKDNWNAETNVHKVSCFGEKDLSRIDNPNPNPKPTR